MKLKRGDRIEIVWIDAGHLSGWQDIEDIGISEEELYVKSIGYIAKVTRWSIIICTSLSYPEELDITKVSGVTEIPKKCIIKKTRK